MTARIVFLVLLALQALLALLRPGEPFGGDEPYYVNKARQIAERGIPRRATAEEQAIARGERWGTADWRPPGYPYFLAACSLGRFDPAGLRLRVTVVQFALLAAALWMLFRALGETKIAAVLLGATPWPFAFVTLLSPDSLNASLMLIAVLLLWRRRVFIGALLASLTIALRPEMIALVPLLFWSRRIRNMLFAGAAFLLVLALLFAYRTYFIGQPGLFGELRLADRGAFAWVHTWIGTEMEQYEVVYGLTNGNVTDAIPGRAFANERERARVLELLARVRREGYSREVDDAFARLAEERRANDPLGAFLLPRVWQTAHLWLNVQTNDQLLAALRHVPSEVRRAILGALIALKVLLLAAFVATLHRDRLVALLAAVVIFRTLLIGLVLGWMAHRYMAVAWPPLLGCVAAGLARYHARRAGLDDHPGAQPRGDAA